MTGWDIAAAQRLGGRETQEDGFIVLHSGDVRLLAIADGAGGHADGEKASQAALQRLRSAFAGAPSDTAAARAWLAQAILDADRDVAVLGAPRTTIVAAWIGAGGAALACHVGDSRLYHFRNGAVGFRTRDHSVVQLLIDMGRLKEEEAGSHPDRSRLTRALGSGDLATPEIAELALRPGDGLALCSDGVWEHASADEIAIALRAPALDRAADELVERAVSRGGGTADNATLILARPAGGAR